MTTYKFSLAVVLLFAFLYCNDTKPYALRHRRTKRSVKNRRYDNLPYNASIPCYNNTLSNLTCTYLVFSVNGSTMTAKNLCTRPDGGTCSKKNGSRQEYGACKNGTCDIRSTTTWRPS
uniref:Lipocalin n=1 Tax=Rhipicephalus appendiculatus TaxID=34631 RepID=A0A131YGS8_RHIAP